MHPRPTRSAPPLRRIKSKKNHVLKDIEEWALGQDLELEKSRTSGITTGNFTDERLLRAKLMEIGKERYRFTVQHTHNMKKFVDSQKMKKILFVRNKGLTASTAISAHSSVPPVRSERYIQSAPLLRQTNTLNLRPKTVQFKASLSKGEYIMTGLPNNKPVENISVVPSDTHPITKTTNDFSTSFISSTDIPRYTNAGSVFSRPVSAGSVPFASIDMLKSRKDQRLNRFGGKFQTVTTDARFALLEKALSKNYETRVKTNVASIIETKESLRQPLRKGTMEARRELELKIKQFMTENNIMF